MALGSTVYNFDIDLSDSDRGVYETLAIRLARHPSESEEFLVARLLAYCLEYEEGIEFSRGGLSDPDDPPIAVRDLTGVLKSWIDIGTPAADRLHRASKSTPRFASTAQRRQPVLAGLRAAKIHRADDVEVYAIERSLVNALAAKLDRRMSFALAVSDREVFISLADTTLTEDRPPEALRILRQSRHAICAAYNLPSRPLEHFHDLRLVRASARPVGEAMVHRRAGDWGIAFFEYTLRSPPTGSAFDRWILPAQDPPGGHHVTVFVPFAVFYMKQPSGPIFSGPGCASRRGHFMFRG